MDAATLNGLHTWQWLKVFNRFCSRAFISVALSDVELWFNPNADELGVVGYSGIRKWLLLAARKFSGYCRLWIEVIPP